MADPKLILEGLARNLRGVAAAEEINVTAHMQSDPVPPAADIVGPEIDWHQALQDGCERWLFVVRVFVGLSNDRAAQERLWPMLASAGPSSVKAAIESDPKLGGACDDLIVRKTRGPRPYRPSLRPDQAGPELLGAEWTVEVVV
jgi:hypothetical protein